MVDIAIPLGGATGPSGPTGPEGLAGGVTGPTGAVGLTGLPGPTGLTGVTGATGAAGPNAPGPTGPQGPTGPLGDLGLTGDVGVSGDIGETGITGDVGSGGPDGVTGPAGGLGTTGPTGVQGLPGPTGPIGSTPTSVSLQANKPNFSSQVVAAGSNVLVTFENAIADGVSFVTDRTLVILTAGLYIFTANLLWGGTAFSLGAGTKVAVRIVKNQQAGGAIGINSGNDNFFIGTTGQSGDDHQTTVSVMDLAAVNDEYEVYVFHNSTNASPVLADKECFFTAVLVGS